MFNFDPNDPRQAGLMAMALGLMGSKGNLGQAIGQSGQQGLMAYQGAQGMRDRRLEEEQQRKMRELQMGQMQRQQQEQEQMRSLAGRAFGPNPNLVANDDMGNAMPQAPGGGGMPEFARGMMGINPMIGAQFMPKPRAPMVLSKGARAFDDSGREIAANPETEKKESLYGKVNVSDYTPASVRKFSQSGNHADLVPYRKPDAPKTQEPRLYDGPEGPVWVTAPSAGQPGQTLPVTDPKGNPISAKKRNQPVTEAQAKAKLYVGMMDDAEKAISEIKLDPSSLKNQTEIALARGDLPMMPKMLQNSIAAKEAQLYAQSTFQWTEAVLRQLTGAAAPEPEVWRQVKTYWPQPGDTKELVARKAQARAAVTEQVRGISGEQKSGGATGGWGIREIK